MLKAKNARLTDRIIQVILVTILKYSEVDISMTALAASSSLYEPTETLTDRNTDHIEAQRLNSKHSGGIGPNSNPGQLENM